MASGDQSDGKCFTCLWEVENISYLGFNGTLLSSPEFTVEDISESKWKLFVTFFESKQRGSYFYLERQPDENCPEKVIIDFELACIASDGTVLHSFEGKDSEFEECDSVVSESFPSRNDVFFTRRSLFLKQDTLTVRCRMWKSVGEIPKNVQCFARTRIVVEKSSVLWNIERFSELEVDDRKTFEIKSPTSGELLMNLQLYLTGGQIGDETYRLKIIPNYKIIKSSTLQLSIVDAYNNTEKFMIGEFSTFERIDSKEFTPYYTKRELLKKKSLYFPNNVLSLMCACTFSCGKCEYEIEFGSSGRHDNRNPEQDDKTNDLAIPKNILIKDLRSLLDNSELADVKLKTKHKTYPAHKLILSLRSPVFKAMFSNKMKENIKDCVDIDDLSDKTVMDILRYIYSAEVEELEWGRAIQLYEAADKYQILNLKEICSSYLKNKICSNNACETLVLADMHQDANLKRFVQDFILDDGEKIMNSEEWDRLMETHLKLAAETMRLKFRKLTQ